MKWGKKRSKEFGERGGLLKEMGTNSNCSLFLSTLIDLFTPVSSCFCMSISKGKKMELAKMVKSQSEIEKTDLLAGGRCSE